MAKYTTDQLRDAVDYTSGRIAGKHNLEITKKQRRGIFRDLKMMLKNKIIKNEKAQYNHWISDKGIRFSHSERIDM